MVDRLGDKAAIPALTSPLDLALVRAVAGFLEDAALHRRQRWVAEQPPRLRWAAVGKIDRGRARPFPAKDVGHDADRLANTARYRVAVLGIADRRPQDLGERHRPVVAQEPHPGAEGARHRGCEQAGP